MPHKFINFIRRSLVDSQGTGQEAFQQQQGYSFSSINGNGGHGIKSSLNATNPATITVGPTHKLNDPFVTGNAAYDLQLQPLYREIEFRRGGTNGHF
jgi:hypothetical protein